MKKKLSVKKSKIIKNVEKFIALCLYALNDGRLAIGSEEINGLTDSQGVLLIYDVKTNIIEQKIKNPYYINYFYQLKNNNLFYYSNHQKQNFQDFSLFSYHYNGLIKLCDKSYEDVTTQLPKESKYNILKESPNGVLYGGITYDSTKFKINQTNGYGKERIEKMVKIKNKYDIVTCFKLFFKDFAVLKNNLIVILSYKELLFYNTYTFKIIKKIDYLKYSQCLSVYNEKHLLVGFEKKILIFDYKNYRIIKYIPLDFSLIKIYVNKNIAFILLKNETIEDFIIQDNGNYDRVNVYNKFDVKKGNFIDIAQIKDGSIITSSPLKIWN